MNEKKERYRESLEGIFGIFQKNWSVFLKSLHQSIKIVKFDIIH